MMTEIGRFKADDRGVIHINSKEEEIEIFEEIDSMSSKQWENLPTIKLDYKIREEMK